MYAYILSKKENFHTPFEVGIYSFKNLKSGFLKFKSKDKSLLINGSNDLINEKIVNVFEDQLVKLLTDIFSIEKEFIEKEV